MKIETTDDKGNSLVIDINPNKEPEPNYLDVVIAQHPNDDNYPTIYKGKLACEGADTLESLGIEAYGCDTTIEDILNLLRDLIETEEGESVAVDLFFKILETGMQSGLFKYNKDTNKLCLGDKK